VTVTDANGCVTTSTATISEPSEISGDATLADALCFGGTGSVDLTIFGGTAPYSYAWSNGSTSEDLTDVAGDYTVTITDANGCAITAEFTISEPALLTADAVASDALCNTDNGSVDLTVTGGTEPYSFSWSNGATTEDITDVAGTYDVTVTDANGCTATASATIGEPEVLTASATTTGTACGQSNGTIVVTASGGTGSYLYSVDGGLTTQASETFTGLTGGTYTVTVTDANGCNIAFLTDVATSPSPLADITGGLEDGDIVCDISGLFPLVGSPAPGNFTGSGVTDNGDGTATFDPAASGIGTMTITYTGNDGTCDFLTSITITVQDANDPRILNLVDGQGFCLGSSPVALTGDPADGEFFGPGVTGDAISGFFFDPAVAGLGAHLIEYAGGPTTCDFQTSITVNVQSILPATISGLTDGQAICSADGSTVLTGTPAGGQFTLNGVGFDGTFDPTALADGSYVIEYAGNDGECDFFTSITVSVTQAPVASISGLLPLYYLADPAASVTVSPDGGTLTGAGVTFDAFNGYLFNPIAAGVGTHTLTYSGTVGNCSYSTSVTVQVLAAPAVCAVPSNITAEVDLGTLTDATIDWDQVPGALRYQVRYREVTSSLWLFVNVPNTQTFLQLSGLNPNTQYAFRVRAVCSPSLASPYSPTGFFETSLPACNVPSGLAAANIGDNSADLSWLAADGADQYEVVVTENGIFDQFVQTGNTVTITGLDEGTEYCFSVRSLCAGSQTSEFSTEFCFTTTGGPCDPATGLASANETFTSADLSWSAGLGNTDFTITVTLGGVPVQTLTSAVPTVMVTGLAPATQYCYVVTGNCAGLGEIALPSEEFCFATLACDAPVALQLDGLTQTKADLSWTGGAGNATYNVTVTQNGSPVQLFFDLPSSSVGLTDLLPGTEYCVTVTGVCEAGIESVSEEFCFTTFTCDAPSSLVADTVTETTADLTWIAGFGNESFEVVVTDGLGNVQTLGAGLTALQLTDLTSGTTYCVTVRGLCEAGGVFSDFSEQVCFFTPSLACDAPTGLIAQAVDASSGLASWTASATAVDYEVTVTENGAFFSVFTTTEVSTLLEGLNAGATYCVTVRSNCGSGLVSEATAEACFTTDVICLTPDGLAVVNVGTGTAQLAWTETTGSEGYEVVLTQDGTILNTFSSVTGSLDVAGLDPNTTYCVSVRSLCAGGFASELSSEVCFTTLTQDCVAPTITGLGIGATFVRVRWNEVPNATTYTVEFREVGTEEWTAIEDIANIPGSTQLFQINGLSPATQYEVRVRTICGAGFSVNSNVRNFFTLAPRYAATDAVVEVDETLLSIYPNPNNGSFVLSVTSTGATMAKLTVTDLTGRTIHTQTNELEVGVTDLPITLDEVTAGVYVVTCNLNGDVTTTKLVVR